MVYERHEYTLWENIRLKHGGVQNIVFMKLQRLNIAELVMTVDLVNIMSLIVKSKRKLTF